MPPLMRLTDSEVEVTDGVVPQVSDGIEDGRGILEKVSSCRLLIQQETLLPDLHIEPVHGDIQPCGQFWRVSRRGSCVHRLRGADGLIPAPRRICCTVISGTLSGQ